MLHDHSKQRRSEEAAPAARKAPRETRSRAVPAFTYLPPAAVKGILIDAHAPADLDPDHHLWKNGRLWWIAFTIHTPDWRKRRLRFSLRTPDIRLARTRRDAVLRHYASSGECELSLRYARQTG